MIIEPEGNVEPRIEQTLTTVAVRAGTTAELICAAQGNPPPTYRYFYLSFISTIYARFVKISPTIVWVQFEYVFNENYSLKMYSYVAWSHKIGLWAFIPGVCKYD